MSDELITEREFERLLCDRVGLTSRQAKTVIAKGYKHLLRGDDAAGEPPGLVDLVMASGRRVLDS